MTRRSPQQFSAIITGPEAAGVPQFEKTLVLFDADDNEVGRLELVAVPVGVRVDVYNADESLSIQALVRVQS